MDFPWKSSPIPEGKKCTLQCDDSSDAPETLGHILVPPLQEPVALEALGRLFPARHADSPSDTDACVTLLPRRLIQDSKTILNPSGSLEGHGPQVCEHCARLEMVCGLLLQTQKSLELPACHTCSESEHRDTLVCLLGKHS